MALSFSPGCRAVLRGAPAEGLAPEHAAAARQIMAGVLSWSPPLGRAWPARAAAAHGFPGLTYDPESGRLGLRPDESGDRQLDRVGLAYLRGDRAGGAPPAEAAASPGEALRHPEGKQRPLAIKTEIAGPVSLSLQICDGDDRPIAYSPALREALLQYLVLRAAWQHDQLSSYGDQVIICLDEPCLDALDLPLCPLDWEEGGDLLARAMADLPGPHGLIVAGTPNWPLTLGLEADVVFFDAYDHVAGLVQAGAAAAGFIERGGALAWGVVPTDQAALGQERSETLLRRLISGFEFLGSACGLAPERVAAAALVSSSGSLTGLGPERAGRVIRLCAELAAQAQEHYGLAAREARG